MIFDDAFLTEVREEVRRARELFPPPNTTFAAAVEEMGEVGKALMDLEARKIARGHLVKECVQLAAMAMRIASEGDPTFPRSVREIIIRKVAS